MSALALARTSLRRVVRDRRALFFLVVLPILVILIVGATARGFDRFRVGLLERSSGPAASAMARALSSAPQLDVERFSSLDAARRGVARGEVAAVVVLPAGLDATLAHGGRVAVPVVTEPATSSQQAAAAAIASVLARVGGRFQAAQFTSDQAGGDFAANLALAGSLEGRVAAVPVTSATVERAQQILPEGYSYSAPTMLVLFVFISALGGGATIVEVRRLGIYERIAAGPVRPASMILGELLALGAVALVQSALIVAIGAAVFGVAWGDPLAAGVLVVTWSLVGASAGMLAGAAFRTPEQASAIGTTLGMIFGMLGGCMWPLAILSTTFRRLGHVVPQAWAVDAWTELLSRGGTLGSIAPQLGALAAFGAGFLLLAVFGLRRRLA